MKQQNCKINIFHFSSEYWTSVAVNTLNCLALSIASS